MKIVVYRKHLLWRVKLIGLNNKIILNSEAYYSKSNAVRAAKTAGAALGVKVGKS